MIWKMVAGFAVATVVTQMLVLGVLVVRGNMDRDAAFKIIALANGIDINGNQLRRILDESESTEAPSYEEVLQQRAEMGLDIDMRLQAQTNFYEQIQSRLRELQKKEERFDTRRDAFNKRLDEIEKGIQDEGLRKVQQILESIAPDAAKTQLLMIFDSGEIDTVVNIVQAMAPEKRKKILEEFATDEEREKLHEIVTRIAEGEPTKTLIDQARADR